MLNWKWGEMIEWTIRALEHLDICIQNGEIEENTALAIRHVVRVMQELEKELAPLRTQHESDLDYIKHLQTELGDSIEYQQKLKAENANQRLDLEWPIVKERDTLADLYKVALDQYKKLSEKNKVLEAENEKLKIAIVYRLQEDTSYCREFSAVLVLEEENQILRARIEELEAEEKRLISSLRPG